MTGESDSVTSRWMIATSSTVLSATNPTTGDPVDIRTALVNYLGVNSFEKPRFPNGPELAVFTIETEHTNDRAVDMTCTESDWSPNHTRYRLRTDIPAHWPQSTKSRRRLTS